ncbi:MAG: glutamate 5-kinase [Verrucomicrobia bacterium CG_4_10_14_3_um_filter_43_23]|nr:MAG: glutamate 5-kinase [Verrucomicrobia bacterium CG1_02_43_26]PIP58497.1 MAG: glutamate 5-kinase [Verrucomicrobia bacterium CG22_combo_CG10-13_8_21_14_all_43_17]PIX58170.1 MAG: glutamate 5-kinase [Verrucomicrobia bacterium CG_4_10_14_3_um_filter_43_23]PIY61144.1 MAG: glutamate 5-kinase [Verrucomicrobia bacterium CG_4_10_14_0_8_um_filter_43_34]PJA43377.1 MAG: glutamate 5-kinase [Verrucomicrobia bacterium CG_4_9_14_3_um_filter_43_20]
MFLHKGQLVVIKLGTRVLTQGVGILKTDLIRSVCHDIAVLKNMGLSIIIVSSGAVGLGMGRLGFDKRPKDITTQQICAAVGQSLLTETWQNGFAPHGINVAQLLLTRDDLRLRNRHVAVKNSLHKILSHGIIPILNENDAISANELKFGDNDILASLVASIVKAQLLVIFSSAPGLLDKTNNIIPVVPSITKDIESLAGNTTDVTGTGGMVSKLMAAKISTQSGCGVFITSGLKPHPIQHLLEGEPEGTFFVPKKQSLQSKKRWIAFFEHPRGSIQIDAGAADALINRGASLLAKGIISTNSSFAKNDVVNIEHPAGNPIARGITQFSQEQIDAIKGMKSSEIQPLFPKHKKLEVIHRDHLVTWEA